MVNKLLAKYILERQWHLRSRRIPKSKIKRIIVNHYVDSGMAKGFTPTAFRDTWEELYKMGLVDKK